MNMCYSAGVTAIIKTVMLPNLFTNDMCKYHRHHYFSFPQSSSNIDIGAILTHPITDDGVNLMVWDMAEISVTMVATCIPVLRVLIKERQSQAGKYYVSHGGDGERSRAGGEGAGPFKSRATQRGEVSVFDRASFEMSEEKITERGESHDEFELVSKGNSGPC
jgi:hypothetical protein